MLTTLKGQIQYHIDRIQLFNDVPSDREVILEIFANLYAMADDIEGEVNSTIERLETERDDLADDEPPVKDDVTII